MEAYKGMAESGRAQAKPAWMQDLVIRRALLEEDLVLFGRGHMADDCFAVE